MVVRAVGITCVWLLVCSVGPRRVGAQDLGAAAVQRDYVYGMLAATFSYYTSPRSEGEPRGLRARVVDVYQDARADRVALRYDLNPMRPEQAALFTAGFEPDGRPRMTVHTPELLAWDTAERRRLRTPSGPTPQPLIDTVGVSIAHERMHFEICRHARAHVHTQNELAAEEAAAWAITIDEIVWPLAKQGRVPYPNVLARAELFWKQFRGNPKTQGWIRLFAAPETQGPDDGATWQTLAIPSYPHEAVAR